MLLLDAGEDAARVGIYEVPLDLRSGPVDGVRVSDGDTGFIGVESTIAIKVATVGTAATIVTAIEVFTAVESLGLSVIAGEFVKATVIAGGVATVVNLIFFVEEPIVDPPTDTPPQAEITKTSEWSDAESGNVTGISQVSDDRGLTGGSGALTVGPLPDGVSGGASAFSGGALLALQSFSFTNITFEPKQVSLSLVATDSAGQTTTVSSTVTVPGRRPPRILSILGSSPDMESVRFEVFIDEFRVTSNMTITAKLTDPDGTETTASLTTDGPSDPTVEFARMAGMGTYTIEVLSILLTTDPILMRSELVRTTENNTHTFTTFPEDFGDAPDSYGTTRGANGARHLVSATVALHFGSAVDVEAEGQPSAGATADDLTGMPDDEDGVVFVTPLTPGSTAQVAITITKVSFVNTVRVDAWADWDQSGFWESDERIIGEDLTAGVLGETQVEKTFSFAVPGDADPREGFYLRFRLSSDPIAGSLGPLGSGGQGEVEDYFVPEILEHTVSGTAVFSGGRAEGDCSGQPIAGFTDQLTVGVTGSGGITITQPSTGDVNVGQVSVLGTFSAMSEGGESYAGTWTPGWSLWGVNRYPPAGQPGCYWVWDFHFTPDGESQN